MKQILSDICIILGVVVALHLLTSVAQAQVVVSTTVLCNNFNWEYSPRCTAPIEHFEMTPTGFKGTLTSEIEWTQDWVLPDMMEFKMEQVNYYVTPEGIIYKNK